MLKNRPKQLCICGHTEDEHVYVPDGNGACKRCGCQEYLNIKEHKSKIDRRLEVEI